MTFFRSVAFALPQILIVLLVAGSHDMLGGWNQTNDAMGTVLILFLLSPVVTLALLVTEVVRCCKANQGERARTFLFIGLAIVLFVEALAIDLYFLSQLRM
jgi:uncharacterized Tic20 family protein